MEPSVEVYAEDFALLAVRTGGRDVNPWLAAAVSDGRGQHLALRRLKELAPDDVRTWAAVLYTHRDKVRAAARDAAGTEGRSPRALAPKTRRSAEEAIRRGRAVDADNAFWDVAEMTLALALRDGARVARAAGQAGERTYYCDYLDDLRGSVARAGRRLSLSAHRARATSLELVDQFDWTWTARVPVEHLARRGARLEAEGRTDEALSLYEGLLGLDSLMRQLPACQWPLRRPGTPLAAVVWCQRRKVTNPPPDGWPTESAVGEWAAEALADFTAFLVDHGRDDLATLTQHAADTWVRTIAADAEEERTHRRMVATVLLPSGPWWMQILCLAWLPVLVGTWLAFRWIAAGTREGPREVWWAVASGGLLATALLLVWVCGRGLQVPSYGLGSSTPPTTWGTVCSRVCTIVPWALAGAAGVAVFAWQRRASRNSREHAARLPDGGMKISRWLTLFCAAVYALMTLVQVGLQAYAAAVLP